MSDDFNFSEEDFVYQKQRWTYTFMYLQKILLVAILVAVCAAKCKNDHSIAHVGSIPCPIIKPGVGTPGLGGGALGFPGLNGEYTNCE